MVVKRILEQKEKNEFQSSAKNSPHQPQLIEEDVKMKCHICEEESTEKEKCSVNRWAETRRQLPGVVVSLSAIISSAGDQLHAFHFLSRL